MKKHIIFTGGGTGGHVYPALAIIEQLIDLGYRISWIGSKKGIEYRIVHPDINFYSIPCGKLRRYFSILNFIDLFKIIGGFIGSLYILIRIKPDLIFSKGGYVTVPPIIASRILKIKSMTHESDYTPGLATRINSRFVNKILVPYENTKEYISHVYRNKVVVSGNPVRKNFFNADKNNGLEIMGFNNNDPIILVIGGSLGAKEINDVVLQSKDRLISKYNIYHQMGEKNYVAIKEDKYKTVPFINSNMADIIKGADLIISRSGAGSVWEFATVGTPSLLIPLIEGSRGDQLLNAQYFTDKGVSMILKGNDVTSNNLLSVISNYFNNTKNSMNRNIQEIKMNNCTKGIVKLIEENI